MFRRVNGKLVSEKKVSVVVKDGRRVHVLRSVVEGVAQKKLAAATDMVGGEADDEAFQELLTKAGPARFVGMLGTNGRLLHPDTLEDVGEVVPGDSFAGFVNEVESQLVLGCVLDFRDERN